MTTPANDDAYHEQAVDLLCSPEADEFALALDECGWMIVNKR